MTKYDTGLISKMFVSIGIWVLVSLFFNIYVNGQELDFQRAWHFGIGLSHNNIRSVQHTSQSIEATTLITDLENAGWLTGWQIGTGHYVRFSRDWGLHSEFSMMHSRRKGSMIENYKSEEIIYNQSGNLLFSNVHTQLFIAPRFQFGTFNRWYVQLGPYMDYNLWNMSSFQGIRTSFFEQTIENGEILLRALEEPSLEQKAEKSPISPFDFGGVSSIGTILALPGDNWLQLEFRYSRGMFRLGDIPGVRQNRFIIVLSYHINPRPAVSYKKYMPFHISN